MSPLGFVKYLDARQRARSRQESLPTARPAARGAVVVKPARRSIALSKHADGDFGIIAVTSLNHLEWLVLVRRLTRACKRLKHGFGIGRSLMCSAVNGVRSGPLLNVSLQ